MNVDCLGKNILEQNLIFDNVNVFLKVCENSMKNYKMKIGGVVRKPL
jgi:hypothetical protein